MAGVSKGRKLKKAREWHRPPLSQEGFARLIGTTRASLAKYETEAIQPPDDVIALAAKVCGIPHAWFFDGEETPPPEPPQVGPPLAVVSHGMRKIRYAGTVPAGDWGDPLSSDEMVEVDARFEHPKRYATRVSGDSCAPALLHGDFLIWHYDLNPQAGLIVLAQRRGDHACTVKQLKIDGDGVPHLLPINPDYKECTADGWGAIAKLIYVERQMPGGSGRVWFNFSGMRPEDIE